jgi:hypothetical protein
MMPFNEDDMEVLLMRSAESEIRPMTPVSTFTERLTSSPAALAFAIAMVPVLAILIAGALANVVSD